MGCVVEGGGELARASLNPAGPELESSDADPNERNSVDASRNGLVANHHVHRTARPTHSSTSKGPRAPARSGRISALGPGSREFTRRAFL